jgi:Kef-type K+ transport system membrane component KefB
LGAFVVSRVFLPQLFTRLAHSAELLLLTSLSWCFVVALNSLSLGFSVEIGAFLAGISLAGLPYNLEISARIRSLRDFFITLFFIALGTQLSFAGLGSHQALFWSLVLFVLIGNPLIVLATMGLLGYRKRTSFMVSLTVGMVSEFSLIVMGMGLKLGQVTPTQVALVTAVGAVTITVTSFALAHAEWFYRCLKPLLRFFERAEVAEADEHTPALTGHVVLIGHHRLGERLAATLTELHKPTIIIDFDPEVIAKLTAAHKPCLYGDMTDVDILAHAHVAQATMTLTTTSCLSRTCAHKSSPPQSTLRP